MLFDDYYVHALVNSSDPEPVRTIEKIPYKNFPVDAYLLPSFVKKLNHLIN
jgi:hypothetical protein